MNTGMGGHQSAEMGKDEWLTPPEIIQALGEFDLDPCAPIDRPWNTANKHYTIKDNGLMLPWSGRVWLNPPYGDQCYYWLNRLAMHGTGTALIFARTETDWFFSQVWKQATAVLFLKGRLTFYNVDGSPAKHNGGAPSVLVAYGGIDRVCMERAISEKTIKGKLVIL